VERFSPGDGYEAARARLGIQPRHPLLVSVRRLEPRMGLDRLLRAVRVLQDVNPVELALVGGGSLDRDLERLAEELGIADRVRLVGRVSDAALPDWYRAGDLFVLPTLAYEGFGLATAEALASGTPVIGTAVGATPELLLPLDERLVARSASPEDLAAAIDAGLRIVSPELRRRCREYACTNFDWNRAIGEWEAALQRIAAT
jgi:glycosyltransferase involved in cell wall biosynthesis